MKIATILSVHDHANIVADTLDSIMTYMTDDVLLLIDGSASKHFKEINWPVHKLIGFKHGIPKSPYRNVALGIQSILSLFDADWYCYMEYDCLVTSERFKSNLKMAEEANVLMLGTNGRSDPSPIPLVESMIKGFNSNYYMLGACQFFHKTFLQKLLEIDFFNRFLNLTNQYEKGFMPGYHGYDVSEHLYPSLCRFFGGSIGVFSTWENEKWHGSADVFPIRWKPEIEECSNNCSIVHPLKDYDSKVREYYRKIRNVSRAKGNIDCG